ncbi:hypothetical protein BV898_12982 [Hypsibius exemplaris]|uniref:Uncharacterized protein n=1 Tax=Hypsibius exemplaris TaxID=2072580 RepID=A0A1W0WC19_HYPEX|nr:hypothetical protein BV898_12982 [Hypsibius exemplaris]
MAQKRAGRGRPRKSPRAATGFPVTRRRSAKAASSSSVAGEVGASSKTAGKVGGARSAAGKTAASPAASSASSSNEPTSAFEALCQVTSAEYERLSGSAGHGGAAAAGANRHNNNNSDNRSDASSKSTEENRQVLQSPSDVQLPAWYGAHIAPSKPYKSELILPPKKKKYLHYLAESEDDNQIINNPFPQHPHHEAPPPRSLQESPPVAAAVPVIPCATTPSSHHPLPLTSGAAAVFSLYPYGVVPQGFSPSPEQLAPLKFNPTPPSSSRGAASACPDTKTFSDVLDEHISRLIIQNDVIVSKQPAVVMSKRGRSRDAAAGGGVAGDSFGGGEGSSTLSSPLRTHAASTAESMVKTLLSSKITRKTMLKENSASRQQARPSGTTFSYLNPENSAIKDLLIKTYEEKGISSQALQATQQQQQTPSTANPSESVRESSDYTTINSQQQQRQFKTPSATTLSRTGCPTNNTTGSGGIVYGVSSDQRSGALVVPDMRHGDGGGAAALNSSNNALVASGWIVSPGNEWVSVDDRGRRRVRPEVTVCPESTTYCLGGSSAATAAATAVASPGGGSRSLRSPSMDSMQSSESSPSSVSFTDSRRVHASGTFQPYRGVARGGLAAEQDGKMRPPSAVMQQPFLSVERCGENGGDFPSYHDGGRTCSTIR